MMIMKYFVGIPLIIIWLAMTLVLACTIFGFFAILDDSLEWLKFPKKAMEIFD